MLYCEPSMAEDVAELIAFLSDSDREEGEAITGSSDLLTPMLQEYHSGTSRFYSVIKSSNYKLVAVGGYNKEGRVWFMMTKEKLNFAERRDFLKVLATFKRTALSLAPVLWNQVMVDNEEHMRLLRFLGADFGDPQVINGRLFKTFNIGGDLWE